MSNVDSYAIRVTKCFDLLGELLTKYPRSIDEVEEYLESYIEYYKDLSRCIPQEKVEVKTVKCKVLSTVVREPLSLDLED